MIAQPGSVAGNTQKAWSGILRNIALPLGDVFFQQRMMKRLKQLEQAQWWPLDRINKRRDELVQNLVRLSYAEVPFYRSLYDTARIDWRDIRTASDLRALPIVTKAMLRANYPQSTTRATGQNTYEAKSSGSTGANFFVREDAETAGVFRSSFLLSLEWAGWTFGERHLQTGITPVRNRQKRLKDFLLGCHYFSAYDMTDAGLDRALAEIERHSIRHLWGYPGSLFHLSKRAIAQGWNRPLKSLVTWGDNLYPHYRRSMEQAFGTRVFDTYGCSEGFQVAAQCGTGAHYHVHALDVVVEVLDSEGNSVPEGQAGDVVITRLHAGAMPFIRYAVGDRCVSGGGRICSCGRGFELLGSIEGRDTDLIITPSGNRLVVHFFTGILEHFKQLDSFQVVQNELDSIEVRIVLSKDYKMSREIETLLLTRLRERGLTDMKVHIQAVPEIPASPSGKRRFVISTIAPRR